MIFLVFQVEQKNDVCAVLEGNLSIQLNRVKKAIEDITKAFEQRLREGVEKSQNLCERKLRSFLYPSVCVLITTGTKPKDTL